ncbi:type II CAAX endopeptidase family protein [Myceligenerans cantabricum]
MRFVWQLVAAVAVAFAGGRAVLALEGSPWLLLVAGLTAAGLSVVVYGLVVRWTERRVVTEVARQGAAGRLVLGTLLGVVLFGFVISNIAFLGSYRVDGLGSVPGAVGLFGFMAAAAATEEVLFRGVLFRKMEEWTGTWVALVVTSAVFGLGHLFNPNADWWGAVVIGLTGGTMLAAAYIATRNLWVPIGVHFGWNFAAGGIFSTEVSGNDTPQGLLDASTSGPVLVTGGALGPEGSVYTLVGCGLATLVLLLVARRRGHLVPRRRSDRRQPAVPAADAGPGHGQPGTRPVEAADDAGTLPG